MKFVVLIMSFAASFSAQADQAATLTCTGKNIVLTEKSPYLGENSPFAQRLYVLQADPADDSKNTAYFLDYDADIGKGGTFILRGTNSAGGNFELITPPFQDVGDGTTIHMTSRGRLDYSHGPLRGTNEVVNCVIQ